MKSVSDQSFKEEVLESRMPTVVHFSLDSEYDARMAPIRDELAESLTGRASFLLLNMSENPELCQKYGVSSAPTLLTFIAGKAVGYTIGMQTIDELRTRVTAVLDKPADEQQELSQEDLKKASKAAQPSGEWTNALTSGLVAGGVFFFARAHLQGAASLIVPGFAMAFFITNGNFRFSIPQKALAILLMFVIGMYGQDMLDWFMSQSKQ
jgi:thioredoxin 1